MRRFLPRVFLSLMLFAVCAVVRGEEKAPAPAAKAPPAAPAPAPAPKPADDAMLFQLKGGGEVVGEMVKETPQEIYIDIGPQIINVPVDSIASRRSLMAPAKPGEQGEAGLGTGTYDPETGTLVFRSREEGSRVLSEQEILDQVKRSVVLVSNPAGLGTGWMVDNEGRIVTNRHVVGTEVYQTVTLFVKRDGQWDKVKIENCEVEAYSSLFDIAIVKLDMDKVREKHIDLVPLKIAEPGSLEAGDVVYAIGNPGMGRMVLDHTISEGIVSSLARNFNDVVYLQTTAPVNPGNSGGPLVNRNGEVVGLVTLKAMFQEGVAFALPVDYIRQFLRYSSAYAISDTNTPEGYRYHKPE